MSEPSDSPQIETELSYEEPEPQPVEPLEYLPTVNLVANLAPIPNAPVEQNAIPAMALSGNNAQRTLWVGDVPLAWSEEKLGEVFTECEHPPYKVKRVYIKGELQPYCFIEFTSFEEARGTLYDLNGNRIPGTKGKNRFNLCFANDSYNPNSEFNVHVSHVPTHLSDAELYRIFDKYQSCRGAKMFRFVDGTSKGSGFVRFGDQTDQQMALVEMNRTRVHNQSIQVRLAGAKGEKLDRDEKPSPYSKYGRGEKPSYRGRPPMIASYRPQPRVEKPRNFYGADNPWAVMPEENDIDPIIGLDLLPAQNRPHTSNKRYMISSDQFMLDLDSSRWTPVVMRVNEKAEDLDKKLELAKWSIVPSPC